MPDDQRPGAGKAPWHLWVIGGLALLWYAAGAYTIQMAQLGLLPDLRPDEAAYYAAKPGWLVAATGVATYGSLLGAVLLLLRRRLAVPVFAIALFFVFLNNTIELSNGTSRVYASTAAAIATAIIALIAAFMLWYSWMVERRGILR